jgi:type IX secretion system PorP/SprF family membrane protein
MSNILTIINTRWTLLAIFIISAWLPGAEAQQIANSSHLPETRIIWNPAMTAPGSRVIADAFVRMQWLGFEGAPFSGFASLQYPINKQNMSAGAIVHYDKTGPVSKTGLQLNYAYKVKRFFKKYDQLSLGISANFQQYAFNPSSLISNDPNDVLLSNVRQSQFFPSVGTGFFYNSNTREYRGNSFYVGAAVNQLFTTDVLVNDFDQARQSHIHFTVGGKIYGDGMYIEPMISANLVQPDLLDVLYSLRWEMQEAFWAGLGYSGSKILAINGGVILPDMGDNYGEMRLGVLAHIGVSSAIQQAGPGVEFYVSYSFEN